jgi:hypothetical protein
MTQILLPGFCTENHFCDASQQRLIHAERRGWHESSSELGQHVHDHLPRDFDWVDIDAGIYTRRHRLLRIVEHKLPGGNLSRAQMDILPLMADAIYLLAKAGRIHPHSGVFRTAGFAPFRELHVSRITSLGDLLNVGRLSGPALKGFLTGEIL